MPDTTGPRGGTTTVTDGGLLRKTAYFPPEIWARIQARAVTEKCTAAEILRRAVDSYLDRR